MKHLRQVIVLGRSSNSMEFPDGGSRKEVPGCLSITCMGVSACRLPGGLLGKGGLNRRGLTARGVPIFGGASTLMASSRVISVDRDFAMVMCYAL